MPKTWAERIIMDIVDTHRKTNISTKKGWLSIGIFSRAYVSFREGNKKKSSGYTRCPPKNHLGVSKNRGTPKWMVYNGKPY